MSLELIFNTLSFLFLTGVGWLAFYLYGKQQTFKELPECGGRKDMCVCYVSGKCCTIEPCKHKESMIL